MTTEPPPTTGLLTTVVISALAPVFFGAAGGDISLARMAAQEVIDEHHARNRVDLLAVGQIVANGLAALGSLGQSMNDEIALPMAPRLRNNAISLNRMVEHNRRVRKQNQDAAPLDLGTDMYVEPASPEDPEIVLQDDAADRLAIEAATPQAEQPAEPASLEEQRQKRTQAKAMIKEASDLSASLRTLPSSEREQAEHRVAMLGRSVRELLTGEKLPPLPHPGDEAAMNGTQNRSALV
ncbi:hypothetical protein [Acidisphaera sp. S103]|uniref:hypothetical protein n=1 Tax=Acidisphaera sp. S103 TaxID=1747223 RepID=UPI00131D677D|nr:hypothetical protein [Acidisphaera sp. S103]